MPTQDPPRQPSQTEVPSAVIGARLRDARERRSLTLREVVDTSEGNFQIATLSAWERGERRIGLASLMWLAEHYGIPVGDLLHPRSAPDGDPVIVVHRGRLAEAAPYWDPLKTLVQRTIDARQTRRATPFDYAGRTSSSSPPSSTSPCPRSSSGSSPPTSRTPPSAADDRLRR